MKRIKPGMIQLGQPLPMDIFTHNGRLLRRAGSTIHDGSLYQDIINQGYVDAEAPGADAEPLTQRARNTLRTLIVDDSAIFIEMLEKNLRHLGLQDIQYAHNGYEAIKLARQQPLDLVFLDIDMPKINGLDTLKILLSEHPHLFICILSASSSITNVRSALAQGAAGFVVKPYQLARLRYIVEQCSYSQKD